MKPTKSAFCSFFTAGFSLLAISSASALDGTWGGIAVPAAGVTSSNWDDPTMWTDGTIADGADFTANFTGIDIAGNKTVSLNGVDRTIGNITFTDPTTVTNDLTISGNTLTLDVATGAPQINVTNRVLNISSIIAGNDGLTKTGAGALNLSGVNTYTGSTTISAGTLIFRSSGSLPLGNTTGITVGGSSAATLQAITSADATTSVPITTANSGVASTIAFSRSSNAIGEIALNGAIGGAGNVIFTNASVDTGGSNQTINLGAAAAHAGSTTINAVHVLTIRNASGAANVLPTGTVLTFGGIGGGGSGRTAAYDLNGQNQTLAGLTQPTIIPNDRNYFVTTATAATLTINNTANFSFGGTTLEPGGTTTSAQITGAISLVKQGTGTFTLGGTLTGIGVVARGHTYTGATQVDGGILNFGGKIYKSAGLATAAATGSIGLGVHPTDAVNFYSASAVGDLFNTNTLPGFSLDPASGVAIDTTNAGATFDQTVALTAARSLTKLGANTLILSQANTYSGGTTLSGGLTIASINGALGSGAINFSGTATGLQLSNGENLANNITIGTATGTAGLGLIRTNGGSATLSGPITINNLPPSGGHFSGPLTITGPISSTVKVSHRTNTVVFSGGGTDSYTAFDAAGGTTKLGANNGLSTAATVTMGVSEASNLDLAGFNQSLAGIAKSTNGATVGNSSIVNDSTLTTTGTSTFGGIIQDALSGGTRKVALTVNGGSLTLTGANTYTGPTTVNAGILAVNGTSIDDAGKLDIVGGKVSIPAATNEVVGSLVLGGVPQLNGVYGSSTSGAPLANQSDTYFAGTGTITVGPPADDFAAWLTENPPATGFTTDSDNDSLPNGIENVLGTNPNTSSTGLTEVSATATSVTYKHTLNPTKASDVNYSYEWSSDLVEWKASGVANTAGTTGTIVASAPVSDVVTVTTTQTGTASSKLFTRIKATNP